MRLRPLTYQLLAGVVLAVGVGGARPAAAIPGEVADARLYDPPAIDWESCPEDVVPPDFQDTYSCATYSVPLDYAELSGPTVELALLRRLAGNPEQRRGTLFLDLDGFGASEMSVGAAELVYSGAQEAYDIVGFDYRGLALSEGISTTRLTGVASSSLR